MRSRTFETHSEEETIALGERLAREIPNKATVLLIGNLGAGKTTMAKGFAQGRGGNADEVSSPTYTLIHEYGAAIYHIDLYRLNTAREAANLGLDEIFDREALVLVEWGERFSELMPFPRWEIRLEAAGENGRRIQVVQVG